MKELHGMPAYVWYKYDGKLYEVTGTYYDGDKKGYAVTIDQGNGPITLIPGEYRTDSLYHWNEISKKIEIKTLY